VKNTLIGLLAILAMGSVRIAHAQEWVDDWFDTHTSTSAGHYESQQRGYYALGSFQGRRRMTNDYPLSISPPKLNVGCGGLDVFLGGFSYLDPEYLVEKFERIIQAAPAFAFEMALSELCKPCVTAMEALEEITNKINSIQVNDCRMSRKIGAVLYKPTRDEIDSLKEEAMGFRAVGHSLRDNWKAFQDAVRTGGGAPPDSTNELVAGCPAPFREIYTNGSVLANVTRELGLSEYADLMRGMVGDVIVRDVGGNYVAEPVMPCPGNDQMDSADIVDGRVELRRVGGACEAAGEGRVLQIIDQRLVSIADKIRGGAPLSAQDETFINRSPLPIWAFIRDAAIANNINNAVAMISEPLALAYAHKIMDDLFRASELALTKAAEVERKVPGDPTAPGDCNTQFIADALRDVKELQERARDYRRAFQANYQKKSGEMMKDMIVARELYELRKQVLSKRAVSQKN
jgi:conjugative transfer pilus assembly protein TraH